MITQDIVVEKILAHLNHQISEAELVRWAEDALVTLSESDEDVPNEETILDADLSGRSGYPWFSSVVVGAFRVPGTLRHPRARGHNRGLSS